MVLLQTRISRRRGEKTYLKSIATIPRNFVKDLSWTDDQELSLQRIGANKLILAPVQPKVKTNNHTYESFAEAVERVLTEVQGGLTWSKIREASGLPHKRPSALWVHRLENERGLEREKDTKSSQIVWRMPKKQFTATKTTLNGWTKTVGSDKDASVNNEKCGTFSTLSRTE
jgi:hypothetical protein